MTIPVAQGGASIARRNYIRPASGTLCIIGGEYGLGTGAATVGTLRLYPLYVPLAMGISAIGCNVSAAGAAGATLIPVCYAPNATGDPSTLVWQGPATPSDAIALTQVAFQQVIGAGNWWVGALSLVGAPTVTTVSRSDNDPRGPFTPTNGVTGSVLAIQSGLAAPPAQFAGNYSAGSAPVLFGTIA